MPERLVQGMRIIHASWAFLWVVSPVLLSAQPSASLRRWIDSEFTKSGAASLTMALAQDGRFVWKQSWGWADKEARIAATPKTMYSLASVSKPITATGLMTLVEQGKIDLDRPINEYLGATKLRVFVGDARDATVRRVANHTAGLPLHFHFFYADEDRRRPPFEESVRRYGIVVAPPGERFQYSNFGYGLLDYIISRASQQSFEEYMQQQIFQPLGLTRMSVGVPPEMAKHQAIRYSQDGKRIAFYDFDHRGGSAIYASAEDLVRFAFLHLKTQDAGQKRILSDASLDAMTRPSVGSPHGIAWQIDDRDDLRIISHGGGMDGVSTWLLLIPAKRIVIVGLCSSRSDLPGRVATAVLSEMFPRLRSRFEPNRRSPEERAVPASLEGNWVGKIHTYSGVSPFRLVVRSGGDVSVQMGDQPRVSVSNAAWTDGRLSGSFSGDIGSDDVRRPHRLRFELTPRSGKLDGPITAHSFPAGRVGDALA